MNEEGKSIPVSLQCPKCAQIMSFNVQRGEDAIAVCDRCQIPLKKLAKIVQSDMELDLEEKFAALSVEVGVLRDELTQMREDLGIDFAEKYANDDMMKKQKSTVIGRLDSLELWCEKQGEDIGELEKYKANKLFKKRPKKDK